MDSYPSELELISLFECLPTKKDAREPFEYDETTFSFRMKINVFEVMVSPFYNRFLLTVKNLIDNETIGFYDFQTVNKIEVISDRKNYSSLRLFMEYERQEFISLVEITFRPTFKVIFKEVLS